MQDRSRLRPSLAMRQPNDMVRHCAPSSECGEQTVHGSLQYRRVIADLRGFPEGLVDQRIEGDDTTDEVAPDRLRVGKFGPGHRQRAR